jgi:hypothetical protein
MDVSLIGGVNGNKANFKIYGGIHPACNGREEGGKPLT